MNTRLAPDAIPAGKYAYLQNVRRYYQGRITGRATLTDPLDAYGAHNAVSSTGTAVSTGGGPGVPSVWLSPGNVFGTGAFATTSWLSFPPRASQYLQASGLGFNLPANAIVTGIQVSYQAQLTGGNPQLVMYLLQGTTQVGFSSTDILTGALQTYTHGDSGSLFGAGWSPAQINGMGVQFRAQNAVGDSTPAGAQVQGLMVTVYYVTPDIPIVLPDPVYSMRRLNDTTPAGPPGGWALIVGAGQNAYLNNGLIQSSLSGKPLSMVPFRPAASPQPWMYVNDANKAFKVNANGTTWKVGIAEPQVAPTITPASVPGPYWVTYRYVYRSSATGATSNPSPEAPATTLAQSTVTASQQVTDTNYTTNYTYNPAQYEHQTGAGWNYFRTTGSAFSGQVTDYIVAKNFGLTVPENVRIDGVQVSLEWAGQIAQTGLWSGAALYYKGLQYGTVKFPGVTNLPPVGAGGTVVLQGGNQDTWGADLSAGVLNDPSFGFGVQITVVSSTNTRSFTYTFAITVFYTDVATGVTGTVSSDPQVDKIDFYRSDAQSDNFVYVGTVPNIVVTPPSTSQVFTDNLSDLAIAGNPILQFDNYEPFPSVDLPRKGTLNSDGAGNLTWASGDVFNVRWLPGTIVLIGGSSPTDAATAFTLYNRPTDSTHMIAANIIYDPNTGIPTYQYPPVGTGLTFEISEPTLAAQPVPAIWGPTDNAAFYFGCGDPLRPGTLYWSKGNNFDSAPDTNQQDVTSPSEPLMNGTIVAGLGMVFSTERAWLIYPTFTSALATVQGTTGSQWNLVEAAITRGLYMRYAITTDGGGRVFYRAKDCIAVTSAGGAEESVTDDIYNLFPHEGLLLAPVVVDGYTIYPPDDSRPDRQTLSYAKGFLYYDYQDVTGTPRTLVFDVEGKGWSVDVYTDPVNVHYWEEGVVNDVLCGTVTAVRPLNGRGTGSDAQSVVATPSLNGGDVRVQKILADLFVRAVVPSPQNIAVAAWAERYSQSLTGFTGTLPSGTGVSQDYLLDLTGIPSSSLHDVGFIFSWQTDSSVVLDYWQVDWSQTPETVGGWKTDLTGYGAGSDGAGGAGLHGWLHVGWFNLAYKSTGPVTVTALTDQGQTITLNFPSTGGVMKKAYQIVPSNKFKLIGWTVSGGGAGFALDAADSEMAIKGWGETGPYHILRPFAGQSPQQGSQV